MIRLLVWVVSDGTMVDGRKYDGPKSPKRRIQFKLSRPEKINRLKSLLRAMDIPFTFKTATRSGVNRLQPYYIRIYGDWGRRIFDTLLGVKEYPDWFLGLSAHQCLIVLDTLTHTDGGWLWRKIRWTTTNPRDAANISELCKRHGIVVEIRIREKASGFANGKIQYHVVFDFGEDGPRVRWKEGGEWKHSVFRCSLAA